MTHAYVGLPPDGAGKKIHTSSHIDINGDEVHTQLITLADRNNPEQRQAVDNAGQASVRFAGGSPMFDAFGRQLVTEPNLVNVFKFYEGDQNSMFDKKLTGTASSTFDAAFGGLRLDIGTDSGDSVKYTSHRYHHYRPGNGMPLIFTSKGGDAGKAGLVRRIGMFDDDDGVFFEMYDSEFNVVIRNGLTGLEEKYERAAWNGDRLDGTGGDNNLSGVTLDPLKVSIWWVDFQYLGAGAVRFGTFVNGVPYVCHTVGHYNELVKMWAANPCLPFRAEQTNHSATGSSSEMHVFCAVIQNQGYPEVPRDSYGISNVKTITSTSFAPVISFRPTQTTSAGRDNRSRIVPRMFINMSEGGTVELQMTIGDVLTGATFANTIKGCEYDTVATASTGGDILGASFCTNNSQQAVDVTDLFDINRDGVFRYADITTTPHITISARLLSAGSSEVGVSANLIEVG